MPETRQRTTPWLIGVGVVTFLAGLLFGYDQGVISGALPLLQADLDLSTIQSEIITSWVTLGALFGALVAGGTLEEIQEDWKRGHAPQPIGATLNALITSSSTCSRIFDTASGARPIVAKF